MKLVPWKSTLFPFHDDFDRAVERFFGNRMTQPAAFAFEPPMNVVERKNDVLVTLEIPGLDAKDVHVECERNRLTVRGEKKFEHESEQDSVHLRECSYGSFVRSIELPSAVNGEKAEARFKKGVLEVVIPKADAAKSRSIVVKDD